MVAVGTVEVAMVAEVVGHHTTIRSTSPAVLLLFVVPT